MSVASLIRTAQPARGGGTLDKGVPLARMVFGNSPRPLPLALATRASSPPFRLGGRGGAGYRGGVKGGGCGDTRADEEVVEPRNAGLSVVDVVVVVAAVAVSENVVAAVALALLSVSAVAAAMRCRPLYLEAVLLGLLDGQGGRRGGSTGGGS